MRKILEGIRRFQRHVYPDNRDLFQQLASGQNPEALFVGCSDSRLALDLITQTGPGDLFVCRNAGNMIPAHGQPEGVSATIEYAVCALRIGHIIVCGHSDCGAMKALLHPETLEEMPNVKQWLGHAEGARRALPDANTPTALTLLTRLNVQLQLEHLGTHPHVFAQVQAGKLTLHGWVYDIRTGDVDVWEAARGEWIRLDDADGMGSNPPMAVAPELQHV